MIQLQGDQRKDVQEFLTDKKEGLELDAKTIKVRSLDNFLIRTMLTYLPGPRLLDVSLCLVLVPPSQSMVPTEMLGPPGGYLWLCAANVCSSQTPFRLR